MPGKATQMPEVKDRVSLGGQRQGLRLPLKAESILETTWHAPPGGHDGAVSPLAGRAVRRHTSPGGGGGTSAQTLSESQSQPVTTNTDLPTSPDVCTAILEAGWEVSENGRHAHWLVLSGTCLPGDFYTLQGV